MDGRALGQVPALAGGEQSTWVGWPGMESLAQVITGDVAHQRGGHEAAVMGPLALDPQLMMGAEAEGAPQAAELPGPARPQLHGDIAGPCGVVPDAQDDSAIEQGQQAQLGGLFAEVQLMA